MNMQNLMAQAQKMQKDIMKKKEEVNNSDFEGKSELVTVKMKGNKTLVSIDIKDGLNMEEDKEVIQDMIVIAVNDAIAKIDKATEQAMGPYGNSLSGLI